MMDVPTISELVTSHTIRIAALESELAELRGQVNKCPTCGEYCKQCKCVESELARVREQSERRLRMLREINAQAGNDAPAVKRHVLTPRIRDAMAAEVEG